MLPGAIITYAAFGGFVAWILVSLAHDLRHIRRQPVRDEPVVERVARQACADSVWPEEATVATVRQIGDLEDLFSLPPYRGRGH